MKKRTVLAAIMAATMMTGVFSGCGNNGSVANAPPVDKVTGEAVAVIEKEQEAAKNSEVSPEHDAIEKKQEDTAQKAAGGKDADKQNAAVLAYKEPTEAKAGLENNSSPNAQANNASNTSSNNDSEPSGVDPGNNAANENTQPDQPSEPTHEHVWHEHTAQRWVPNVVTVVDEPERYEEYDMWRFYWYNTGTWEETRDYARWDAWWNDWEGGYWAPNSMSMVINPEDCPLFIGYNELGQESYMGDHVHWIEYEKIPAVTHEEDQGYYETYTDYYYCDCGAVQ